MREKPHKKKIKIKIERPKNYTAVKLFTKKNKIIQPSGGAQGGPAAPAGYHTARPPRPLPRGQAPARPGPSRPTFSSTQLTMMEGYLRLSHRKKAGTPMAARRAEAQPCREEWNGAERAGRRRRFRGGGRQRRPPSWGRAGAGAGQGGHWPSFGWQKAVIKNKNRWKKKKYEKK